MPKCINGYEVKIMSSGAGYYLGTSDPEDGCPYCRVSSRYAKTEEEAKKLLPDRQGAMENMFCHGGRGCCIK